MVYINRHGYMSSMIDLNVPATLVLIVIFGELTPQPLIALTWDLVQIFMLPWE